MKGTRLVIVILLLIAMLAMAGNFAFAQEPALGTPEDNACNPGGLMWRPDGNGCTTDWAWSCGWYLARWVAAGEWFGKYPFPVNCASVLPPPPEPPAVILVGEGTPCLLANDNFVANIPAGAATYVGNVVANDCNPQLPLVGIPGITLNNAKVYLALTTGAMGVICNTGGGTPYDYSGALYGDGTGRIASISGSGNCN